MKANPYNINSGIEQIADPLKLTIYVTGDSSAGLNPPSPKTGKKVSWADVLDKLINFPTVRYRNCASPGYSLRDYFHRGTLDSILSQAKSGDIILASHGHLEGCPLIREDGRARGSLPGAGEETETIFDAFFKREETVHTFGWYLKSYIQKCQRAGIKLVFLSPPVRNTWNAFQIKRTKSAEMVKIMKQVCDSSGAMFLDFSALTESHLNQIGIRRSELLYLPDDEVHTNIEGALTYANLLAEALLNAFPLNFSSVFDVKSFVSPVGNQQLQTPTSRRAPARYFGVNQGRHDGGIVCFDEFGNLQVFCQSERLTRIKTDRDVGSLDSLLRVFCMGEVQPADLFFNTWPSHYKHFYNKQEWPENFLHRPISRFPGFHRAQHVHFLPHHLSHIAAAWMFRQNDVEDECLYIAFDASGYRDMDTEGFYSVGVISPIKIEERAFALDKLKYSPQHRLDVVKLPNTAISQIAGKLMGLAGYVDQDKIRYLPYPYSVKQLNSLIETTGLTTDLMEKCASIYSSYIRDIKGHLATVLATYPHKNVVVGGGLFLALEINSWLEEQGRRVIFGPPTNDSGIALGSAALGYFYANGKWPRRLESPFLQWQPDELRQQYISPFEAAGFLARGEVLGLLIGRGEAGPRALGNRSLLAIPTSANARNVSAEIKGREFFRPVAPIVTDREFSNLFSGSQGRYMQFRNFCTSAAKTLVPGVVHNDNTARAQVLYYDDNPWLYEVLVNIGKLTGAECLINTSLNGKGRPICNTLADATSEFANTKVRIVSF